MIRAQSIKAFEEELPKLNRREKMILTVMRSKNVPLTDRQIMVELGFQEPNSVRPRLSHLIEIGLVREVGVVKCEITGKSVRQSWSPPKQEGLPMQVQPATPNAPYQPRPMNEPQTVADGLHRSALRQNNANQGRLL
jgi:hypothetical protein